MVELNILNNKANTVKEIFITKWFPYFLISIFILFLAPNVNAQTLSSSQVKSDVAKLFEAKYQKLTTGDVEVKIVGTQFAQLQLPDGKVSYKIVSGGEKIIPRDIKRVDVYVDNAYIKTLNLPAQTSVYKDVLVASDFINREQSITKECTSLKRIDISMKMDYVLDDRMLNKEMSAKKAFQKGEIIDKRFVRLRPDVARNSDVRVFFVSNGSVMVAIDGTAMTDGMIGDYINVENKNYKKVYNGKVIGENRVLVNI